MLTATPRLPGTAERLACPAPAHELALWLLDARHVSAAALDLSILDHDERARVSRLRRDRDRVGYMAAHVWLRVLISERIGLSPQDVIYGRESCAHCSGAHGRPVLAGVDPPLQFSISHHGDLALLALAGTRVGVDIEALPSEATLSGVAALLHPAERAEVMAAASHYRSNRFASIWTRKEAYLKAIGAGIGGDLAADCMAALDPTSAPAGYVLFDVPVPAGYAAAVAQERSSP